MKKMKEEITNLKATGSAGAGMVEVTINGDYMVQDLSINEAIVDKNDKQTMEVLIVSAFNDASQKIKTAIEDLARNQAALMGFGRS